MLYDAYQRRQIIDRCWLIYDLISEAFEVPQRFHPEILSVVELALTSGYLQLCVEISRKGHLLYIHEEYDFRDYEFVVKVYSYNLLDKSKDNIIRADPLPHHQVDYKRRKLAHFPHHLHAERGRICSFSGWIEDFVKRSVLII